jgi:heparan-sulfate lyase
MTSNENRRQFLKELGLISFAAGSGSVLDTARSGIMAAVIPQADNGGLYSLSPSLLFSVLDMDLPELAPVRKILERKGNDAALAELLKYYRSRYPPPATFKERLPEKTDSMSVSRADDILRHIFQWGPYAPTGYGDNIDWAADPAGDIEWVAAIYRFYWVNDLVNAYAATGDEHYAAGYVSLITDWIGKHPLEKTLDAVHPVYGWKGYPWLDLQTGIRATNICSSFRKMVNAKSFTPQFLGVLMASLYDHQVKTEKMPMGKVHNKAIFEQRGFFNVLHTFREFRDRKRWLGTAIGITCENLFAQTTSDGVQREWCGGYHSGVYRDALEIESRVDDLGSGMPEGYHERVKAMADHIFGISTPDLGFPMFGDTSRAKKRSGDRRSWSLYDTLTEAGRRFGDPKFNALADLDQDKLPLNGSTAFPDAGLYAMRNNWTPGQVYMALHCSPPAISTHDTPDNGTFELYAYGRWLMPDTGFYTYGHDKEARAWHRQTKVHPTMTLNGRDTNIAGRQLLWKTDEDQDVLCIENQSYQYFLHRRTVWFAGKRSSLPFFVILDEANGDSYGDIEIRFPMAPGNIITDMENNTIRTGFDDANLLIRVTGKHPVILREEEGWHAWEYGKREPRTTVAAMYKGQAPFVFCSVLVPYRGLELPSCRLITDPSSLMSGKDPVEIETEVGGQRFRLIRDI